MECSTARRGAQAQWRPGWAVEAPSSTPDAVSLPETGRAAALTQETLLRPLRAAAPGAGDPSFPVARFRPRRAGRSASPRGSAGGAGTPPPEKANSLAALIRTRRRPPNVPWPQEEIPLMMYFQGRRAVAGGGGEAFNLSLLPSCLASSTPRHVLFLPR